MTAIDFGCHSTLILEAAPGAILAIALLLMLAGLGSVVGGSKRFVAADIISGWGIVVILFTIGGIFFPGSLPLLAIIFDILSLSAIAFSLTKTKRSPWPLWLLIALISQIWIVIFINRAGISGWDDIAQWTPNALFLWHHNGFPSHDLTLTYSNRPAYPYALAYLGYLVSFAQNGFVVQAGAMINWLLLASFAWALTALNETERTPASQFMRFACALLLVTAFNPGFNASFSITNQTDMSTSVVVGFLGLLLLQLHKALQKKDRTQTHALAWQISMAAVTLTLLRDMNIILLALLAAAFLLIALREKYFTSALRLLTPGFILGAIFFALWRQYTQHAITHDHASPILPFGQWRFDMAPQLLTAVGLEMLKKNGFYVLMVGVSGFGIWAFLRGKRGSFTNPAVLTAMVFCGYTGFILLAFIGSTFFTDHNIAHAMSFYRYGTHTGLLGILMLWLLFERYIEPRLKKKTLIPVALFAFALLPLAYVFKSSWLVPHPSPALCAARNLGDEIANRLPPQSQLTILDPNSNGFEPFVINLELAFDDLANGHDSRVVEATNMFEPEKWPHALEHIRTQTEDNAVLLRNPDHDLRKFFGLKKDSPLTLVLRQNNRWRRTPLPDSPP